MESISPNMQLFIAFGAGVLVTLMLVWFNGLLKARDKQAEIDFLQFERDHREQIRESKIHRDRIFRRSVFGSLFFFSIVAIVNLLVEIFSESAIFENSLNLSSVHIVLTLWSLYIIYVYILWQRYKNINNFQKMIYKIDGKLVKARQKMASKKVKK